MSAVTVLVEKSKQNSGVVRSSIVLARPEGLPGRQSAGGSADPRSRRGILIVQPAILADGNRQNDESGRIHGLFLFNRWCASISEERLQCRRPISAPTAAAVAAAFQRSCQRNNVKEWCSLVERSLHCVSRMAFG